jgi:hypothetical protein
MLSDFHIFIYLFRALNHFLFIFKVSGLFGIVKYPFYPWAQLSVVPSGLGRTRAARPARSAHSPLLSLSRETLTPLARSGDPRRPAIAELFRPSPASSGDAVGCRGTAA